MITEYRMLGNMRVERLSERAVILRDLPREPFELARILNASATGLPEHFEEAVASYETLGLYFSQPVSDTLSLEDALINVCAGTAQSTSSKLVTLPVCYELGEDLSSAADTLHLTVDELIAIHLGAEYRCYAIGFSPGFAYLGYLDDRIATLPRLPAPRKRIEPGSVGITGRQTAVYPSATPGGWNLIGRCPLELVNIADGYFSVETGDMVKFSRIDEGEFHRQKGERL